MKAILITLILAFAASTAFAAGTYEDTTHTQWGATCPFKSCSGTWDLKLRWGSSAIDAASADEHRTIDARGRAVPQNKGADIGAYESSKGTVLLDEDFVKFYKP